MASSLTRRTIEQKAGCVWTASVTKSFGESVRSVLLAMLPSSLCHRVISSSTYPRLAYLPTPRPFHSHSLLSRYITGERST